MPDFIFRDWTVLLRTFVVGVASYAALIAILRVSGKRTLAKMNAFDFIVTIALGSTLASILLSPDVALAEGLLALGLLVALQYAVAFTSVRFGWVKEAVTAEPTLLVLRGELLRGPMRRERVPEVEIHQAARQQGFASLDDVEAVVLESDGTFSVLGQGSADASTLGMVPAYRRPDEGDGGGRRHQQRSQGTDRQVEG